MPPKTGLRPTGAVPTQHLQATLRNRDRSGPSLSALARLHLTYLWRHRRRLSIESPTRFTEFVQRRKAEDRDPRLPGLIDKLMVKHFVCDLLGPEWVTPTLWSGDELPSVPPCIGLHVVKSRHGCGQMMVVDPDEADWTAVRGRARSWMRGPYGRWLDEWGYQGVPRGLMIEPFIGTAPTLPIDYKLYVFHGRVEAVQVHFDRATDHRWSLFDRSWNRLSTAATSHDDRPPTTLARMIDGAEILGSGFDFVRIDFYDVGPVPRFGEMTFYPGSGLDRFDPVGLDLMLGGFWRAGPEARKVSCRIARQVPTDGSTSSTGGQEGSGSWE